MFNSPDKTKKLEKKTHRDLLLGIWFKLRNVQPLLSSSFPDDYLKKIQKKTDQISQMLRQKNDNINDDTITKIADLMARITLVSIKNPDDNEIQQYFKNFMAQSDNVDYFKNEKNIQALENFLSKKELALFKNTSKDKIKEFKDHKLDDNIVEKKLKALEKALKYLEKNPQQSKKKINMLITRIESRIRHLNDKDIPDENKLEKFNENLKIISGKLNSMKDYIKNLKQKMQDNHITITPFRIKNKPRK